MDPLAVELVFSGAYVVPNALAVDLVLGPLPGAPGSTVDATLDGTVRVHADIQVGRALTAVLTATVRVQASISAQGRNTEKLTASFGVPWKRKTQPLAVDAAQQFAQASRMVGEVHTLWSGRVLRPADPVRAPWRGTTPMPGGERAAPWQQAAPLNAGRSLPWGGRTLLRADPLGAPWRDAAHLVDQRTAPWDDAVPLRTTLTAPWRAAAPSNAAVRALWHQAVRRSTTVRIPWRDGRLLSSYGRPFSPAVPPIEPPEPPQTDLHFCTPLTNTNPLAINLFLGVDPCGGGAAVIVPIRSVYIVINSVLLRRVEGDILLPALSFSMNLDADSWTWGFSASLPAEELPNVEPSVAGAPVELEATINGNTYRLLAERISRERTFGRARINVSGRGKNAILDAPYSAQQSFSNGALRTAAQLMDDVLTTNGVSIGWLVDFGLEDWLVPAGAFAHQGTYISALTSIAGAAGGYLQPHPIDDTVRVLPRYPTAPWDWATLLPDFQLPAAVTTREAIEWVDKPTYNRVFLSGRSKQFQVTRTGTAGDILAPTITEALLTDTPAGMQRGRAVLSDTGRQANLSLRLPVLEETGIIEPGKFVRFVDGAVQRLGIVRSTSVEVAMPGVFQTIGVETHA